MIDRSTICVFFHIIKRVVTLSEFVFLKTFTLFLMNNVSRTNKHHGHNLCKLKT